jgi:ATP/maltotriose-dependent transcriptional regulator MalT
VLKPSPAALAIASAAGDGFNTGYASGTRATAAAFRGDLAEALRLGEAALAVARQIDQQWAVARTLLGLGDLARLTGHPAEARQHYQEAFGILREVNARPEMARCLAGLGRIETGQGELALARQHLGESIELSLSTGSRFGVIRGLDSFAALAIAQGNLELAVQLAAAAAALRSAAGLPEPQAARTERLLSAAAVLGDAVIAELWAAGSALSSDAAVALALGAEGGPASAEAELTAREREIAILIFRGLSNKAIADDLDIRSATVARHVANIMGKLEFTSRIQIANWVLERGY